MKRPPTHVTDDLGKALLIEAIASQGWAYNEVQSDYGVDFDVEVFQGGKSTGITFKVQLKSSDATSYSAGEGFVSQQVDVPNGKYLVHEQQTRTVLVHGDVKKKRM